jgi:hypothetical protein
MRWSWDHATDEVWRKLDPGLWEITHNPWVVLQTVSRDQIERVLRQAGDYTARVIPQRAGAAVPLESGRILWQRLSKRTNGSYTPTSRKSPNALTFGRGLLCLWFTPVVEIDVRAMNFENASLPCRC